MDSSNLEKYAAWQLMRLDCLSGSLGTLAEKEEIQRGRKILSSSMCILWLCRFFHWEYSSDVSLVTEPKLVKEVLDSQPQKKQCYVFFSIIISPLWYPPRTFPYWPLPVPCHITPGTSFSFSLTSLWLFPALLFHGPANHFPSCILQTIFPPPMPTPPPLCQPIGCC